MAEWVYKAKGTKVGEHATRSLAIADGFLCRTAHNGNGTDVARVAEVAMGDLLHFYFVKNAECKNPVGTFKVVTKDQHPHPEWFGEQIEGTALYAIADDTFIKRRDPTGGYDEDVAHGVFTGWVLKRLPTPAPRYRQMLFRGTAILEPYPLPSE